MNPESPTPGPADVDTAERDELARSIDALMAMRPRPLPSIIVLGDDAVFGITPAERRD